MSRIDAIQLRRDTAARWTSVNPILLEGEAGLETDTNQLKFGNGTDRWAVLPYFGGTGGVSDGDKGDITVSGGGVVWNIDAGVVTDVEVAAANKDGAAGTPSMRTLGTGATQACAGNDARLSDARTPLAHNHDGSAITTGTVAAARLGSGSGGATKFLREDSTWQTVAGAGEVNTASNVGAGGVGVWDAKVGVDLQFRNINAASSKVSVALDAPNKEVDIDVVPANFTGIPESGVTNLVSDLAARATVAISRVLVSGQPDIVINSLSVNLEFVAGTNITLTTDDTAKTLTIDATMPSHSHDASDITSGTMATARLGSGTANNAKWLRGDQSWSELVIENRTSDPGSPVTGQVWLRTDL